MKYLWLLVLVSCTAQFQRPIPNWCYSLCDAIECEDILYTRSERGQICCVGDGELFDACFRQ